ncbi:MAG: conjugal transfer protein [Catenibacillus sp.]|nr:conjugal transfer protein [Catenibacillus sp.]
MRMKKEKKAAESQRQSKVKNVSAGLHKKSVLFLWVLLIGSVAFGIYKNFTAVDTHTVHETERIEEKLVDTNAMENFVRDFAEVYYSWTPDKAALEARYASLGSYVTADILGLNRDVLTDVTTTSSVMDVQIWQTEKIADRTYKVGFVVKQNVVQPGQPVETEAVPEKDKKKKPEETVPETTAPVTMDTERAYQTVVYVDENNACVIIKSPVPVSVPGKSPYELPARVVDGTVSSEENDEITSFLDTFFKLYPTATAQELSYYVKDNALSPVPAGLEYAGIVSMSLNHGGEDGVIEAYVAVRFYDTATQSQQVSQYDLRLKKENNWMIVK